MTTIDIKNELRQIPIEKCLITLLLAFLFGGCLLKFSMKQLMFLIIGTLTLLTCFSSIRNSLYLLVFAAIVIPSRSGLLYVTGIEIGSKNIKIIEIIYVATVLSWSIQILLRKIKLPEFKRNVPFYFFFTYFVFSVLIDWFLNGKLQDTFTAARHLFYYGIYFVFLSTISHLKDVKILYNTVILGTLTYSLIIVSMCAWPSNPLWQFIIWKGTFRPSFGGSNYILLALPLIFSRFVFSSRLLEKIIYTLLSIPMFFALIMGQYRVGWIVLLMFLPLFFIVLMHKRVINLKQISYIFVSGILVLLVLFICLNLRFGPRNTTGLYHVINRLTTFKSMQTDSSVVFRVEAAQDDFRRITKNPIWGEGYSRYFEAALHKEIFMDNTHTQILRRMGLIGYTLFIWIFLRFWKNVVFIFRYSSDKVPKEFSIALISLFPGMVFLTFTNAYLVAYDFIFVFATLMAIAEFMARRIKGASLQITTH